jgi:hypothetical protein
MPDKFNDDQGTRISEEPTGAGAEATQGTNGKPARDAHKHRSAYGGEGGEPKKPNEPRKGDGTSDVPTSRR